MFGYHPTRSIVLNKVWKHINKFAIFAWKITQTNVAD